MFNLKDVEIKTTDITFIAPTYNVIPNVTVPPFLNLIADLNVVNVVTESTISKATIVDGVIVSGTLLTDVDCSVSLTNAIILHGVINPDTLITDVTIITTCGTTFKNLTIQDAIIQNVTLLNVEV